MTDIFALPSIGPYTGVSHDRQVTFGNRTFRVILYAAYNAYGLIGTECNGIAILDEDNHEVLVDEIAKQGSGYFGPSEGQVAEFEAICAETDFEVFRAMVNASPRARRRI